MGSPPARPPATPPLAHYTGYLLRRAHVRSQGCARDCIADDSHIREVVVLSALAERGAISQRELGDLMHVNRSTMVKLVDSLEAKGHVVRERNPDDRRSYALRLTAAGEGARVEAHRDLDAGEAALADALTEAEAGQLKQALQLLLADEPGELTSLSDRLGYLIATAHRVWRTRAETALAPLSLHPRDFGALSTIARHQPCSQTQLAANLGISPPMALAFVDALEAAGLVVRARNPSDRRVHDLTLTEEGGSLLGRAQQAAGALQGEMAALLGPDVDAELRSLLAKLVAPTPPLSGQHFPVERPTFPR